MVQPAMGSGEPSGAVRLRAAARSVARQFSHFLMERLVHRPRVFTGDGSRDALGMVAISSDLYALLNEYKFDCAGAPP